MTVRLFPTFGSGVYSRVEAFLVGALLITILPALTMDVGSIRGPESMSIIMNGPLAL